MTLFSVCNMQQECCRRKTHRLPPSATPTPTPGPRLITPLNVGIAIVALIIIAVILRFVTRGKAEETSSRIR